MVINCQQQHCLHWQQHYEIEHEDASHNVIVDRLSTRSLLLEQAMHRTWQTYAKKLSNEYHGLSSIGRRWLVFGRLEREMVCVCMYNLGQVLIQQDVLLKLLQGSPQAWVGWWTFVKCCRHGKCAANAQACTKFHSKPVLVNRASTNCTRKSLFDPGARTELPPKKFGQLLLLLLILTKVLGVIAMRGELFHVISSANTADLSSSRCFDSLLPDQYVRLRVYRNKPKSCAATNT